MCIETAGGGFIDRCAHSVDVLRTGNNGRPGLCPTDRVRGFLLQAVGGRDPGAHFFVVFVYDLSYYLYGCKEQNESVSMVKRPIDTSSAAGAGTGFASSRGPLRRVDRRRLF